MGASDVDSSCDNPTSSLKMIFNCFPNVPLLDLPMLVLPGLVWYHSHHCYARVGCSSVGNCGFCFSGSSLTSVNRIIAASSNPFNLASVSCARSCRM